LSSLLPFKNLKIKIFKEHNSTVLYLCETWSLALSEEPRMKMFENVMLRRIFRPKREEVAGGRRRLHNEELNNVEAS
jgi:hypothetical protein